MKVFKTKLTKSTIQTVSRRDVKPGQVFRKQLRDGAIGDNVYAALPHNGKNFSINLNTGNIASSVKHDAPCKIVGSYELNISLTPNQLKETTRSEVKTNEVFRVKGGDTLYLNLGMIDNHKRYISLPVHAKFDNNYAVTENGNSAVVLVGTYNINAKLLG